MDKHQQEFAKNLTGSINPVLAFTKSLVLSGKDVLVKGMSLAPSHKDWKEHADEGYDVIVDGQKINIKCSSYEFNSLAEYTRIFKKFDRPVLVSACHVPTADLYVILNKAMSGAIVISSKTKPHWGTRSVFDKRYGVSQECFDVSPKYCSWRNING